MALKARQLRRGFSVSSSLLSFKNKQTNMALCGTSKWKILFTSLNKANCQLQRNNFEVKRQFHGALAKYCQKIGQSFESEHKNEDLTSDEEHEKTIYQGILSTQIKLIKGFSLSTSMIGLCSQPIFIMQMQQNNSSLAVMVGTGVFMSFFTFVTPMLIHSFSKKYVTQLNYNRIEDSYTAFTYSLFLRKKEVNFQVP